MTPRPVTLAIVGSTELHASEAVVTLLRVVLTTHQPAKVLHGGGTYVDTAVERLASELGIPVEAFIPEVFTWDGKGKLGIRGRYLKMLDACTTLVVIRKDASLRGGPAWVRDQAEKMRRTVEEHVVAA